MSFAEIEVAIGDFARRAKENKLKVEELQGGTFTISNAVFTARCFRPRLSTRRRAVFSDARHPGASVAREGNCGHSTMMYLALTYDHRIVDGREAVTFLRRIKEVVESPARMLMEV